VAAVASSLRESPLDQITVVMGEVGLGGEIRAVNHAELRVREAAKLGFCRAVLPSRNVAKLDPLEGFEFVSVQDVTEALDALLG